MNGFDMGSHVFSLLPIFVAYRTRQMYLLYFTVATAIISLIYHFDENAISLHIDEFASSALIIVTFLAYMDEIYKPTYFAIALLLVVVLIDYYVQTNIVIFFVGMVAVAAILVFFYERKTLKETPRRLRMDNAYFISFVSTQLIAIAFFLWDKDPYAHSLWHMFAFISLGSAIAHVHENDENMKRKAFYCLGSIPSRVFISAILIHWNTAVYPHNLPVAVGALLLALLLFIKPLKDAWDGSTSVLKFLHGVSYVLISVFLFLDTNNNVLFAGVWLLVDTISSAYVWYNKNKPLLQTISNSETPVYKKIQLENLRF